MQIIYIYNEHSELDRLNLDNVKKQLGDRVVHIYDYQEIKHLIPVRETPALLFVREDLQGASLYEGDVEMKMLGHIAKGIDEEEIGLFNRDYKRMDMVINNEKIKAVNAFKNDVKADLSPEAASALPQSVKTKLGLE